MSEPTTTYEWRIERLDAAPIDGELENVVRKIHWRLLATDGINTTDTYGDITLGSADPSSFIPYPEITSNEVIEWLEAAINARAGVEEPDVEQLRAGLAGVLAALREPKVIPMPLPWE